MKKLFSKFKVIVPMLFCLMSFAMVGLVGCGEQAPKPEGHVHSITLSSEEQPATCVEQGRKAIYKCSGCDKTFLDAEGKTESTTENSIIPIDTDNHDYNYAGITFSPVTENEYTGKWKATVTCKRKDCTNETANHTLSCETTIDATVKTGSVVAATCKDNGSVIYVLTFSEDDMAKLHLPSTTVEQTVSTPKSSKHDYDYSNISYKYFDDDTKCIETVKCKVCEHTCSYDSESYTTVVNSEANCTTPGKKTIKFIFGNALLPTVLQEHNIERTIPIDPNKHSCTAVDGMNATCTVTGLRACYKCSWCNKFFDNVDGTGTSYNSQPTIGMLAHTYGTATYSFSDDKQRCTASVTCSACGKEQTFSASATRTAGKTETCVETGSYTLSATFNDEGANVLGLTNNTYTKTITIEALGHNYGTPTYLPVKSEEYSGIWQATRICTRTDCTTKTDGHTLTLQTEGNASVKTTPATCKQTGSHVCTLTFSDEDKTKLGLTSNTHTETVTIGVDSKNHNYNTAGITYTFEGETSCTATVECSDCKVKETLTSTSVNRTNVVAATCKTDGSYTLTATFSDEDAKKLGSSTHNSVQKTIAKLEHDYSEYTYSSVNKQWTQTCKRKCGYTSTKGAGGSNNYPYLVSSCAELQEVIALGGYVRVDGNGFNIDRQLKFDSSTNKSLSLDLGGYTLTSTFVSTENKGSRDLIYVGGCYKLTVTHGKIDMQGTYGNGNSANHNVFGVYGDDEGASTKLTLGEDLTVTNNCGASCVYILGKGASLDTSANLYSTGTDSWHSAVIQGFGDNIKAQVDTVDISGGEIESTCGLAIYIPNLGTYNISGGTIKGSTALYAKAGNIEISGGTFTAKANKTASYAYRIDGWNETGEAVILDSCGYAGVTSDNFKVKISDKVTFNVAEGSNAFKIGCYKMNSAAEIKLTAVDASYSVNKADYLVYGMYERDAKGDAINFKSLNININPSSSLCAIYDYASKSVAVGTYVQATDSKSSKLYIVKYTNSDDKTVEKMCKVDDTKRTFEYVSNETYACYVTSTSDTSKKVYYDSLQSAVDKSLTGETITLTRDVTFADGLVLNTDKAITFDLGGHKISSSGNKVFNIAKGSYTFKSGNVNASGDAFQVVTENDNTATLTLESDLNVTASWNAIYIAGKGSNVDTSANLTSTGAFAAIQGNGKNGNNIGILNITGGNISAQNTGIYLPNSGTYNITDGTITGSTAVYIKCGNLTIGTSDQTSKPTFVSTVTTADIYKYNGNGCEDMGDVISIDSCGYPGGAPTVTIYSCNYQCGVTNGNKVAVYNNYCLKNDIPATINNYDSNLTVAVYDVVNSLTTDVMSKVNANDTVVLYDDIDLGDGHILIDETVTFDLNGKILTGNGADGVFKVVSGGNLTITGNGSVVAKAGIDGDIYAMAIFARGGSVTIKNGNFSNEYPTQAQVDTVKANDHKKDNLDLIYAKDDGNNVASIIIEGGTFNCVEAQWTLNIENDSKSTIKVYGGTFIGFDPDSEDNGGALNSADVNATQKKYFTESGYTSNIVKTENNVNTYEVKRVENDSNSVEKAEQA